MYSARFDAALTLAGLRHAGQVRKGSGAPYLVHLVHVAAILARAGYDENTQIVGLLHDIIEDTTSDAHEVRTVSDDIRNQFGASVIEAVETLSEPKRDAEGNAMPWQARKDQYIAQLKVGSTMALHVSAADKLHNLATLAEQLEHRGESVWKRFKVGPDETFWFYRSVHEVLKARTPGPLVDALGQQIGSMS
ncbi:MAG: HD domain-containing protein [Myxococcota bacterium]